MVGDDLIAAAQRATRSPGVVFGVLRSALPVSWACAGTVGVNRNHPLTERTPIAAASVTKQMVGALAAMVDSEQPRFANSELGDWCGQPLPITLSQALSHDHGMRNPLWLYHGGVDRAELARRVGHLRCPGVGFSYQDAVFALAGQAVETAVGMPLEEFARLRLWAPSGMQRTALGAAQLVERRDPEPVSGSSFTLDTGEIADDPVHPDQGWTMDSIAGAGAMVTTCDDLASWVRQILLAANGAASPLHAAVCSAMQSRVTTPLGDGPLQLVAYGWGFRHFRSRGRRVLGHGGLFRGMATLVAVWPDHDVGVVGFANGRAGYDALFELADEVVGRQLGDVARDQQTVFARSTQMASSIVTDTMRRWTPPSSPFPASSPLQPGCFEHPWLGRISVEVSEGELLLRGPGPFVSARLIPVGERAWFPSWNEALPNYRPASHVVINHTGTRLAWWDEERATGWSAFERIADGVV